MMKTPMPVAPKNKMPPVTRGKAPTPPVRGNMGPGSGKAPKAGVKKAAGKMYNKGGMVKKGMKGC